MPKQLKNILNIVIKPKQDWHATLLSSWHLVLGDLSSKVRLEKIESDTLTLGVYDACWMQELYLMTPLLIATINQKLDRPYIKHLRFKRAVARKNIPLTSTALCKEPETIALKPAEYAALEKIHDPQLSMALHQFLIRCYKEKK